MATSLWAMALAFFVTILGTFAALFLKIGSAKFSLNPVKFVKNYMILLGLMIYGVNSILFIIALKGGELSVLFPMLSVGYIWIALASMKFLGEKMTMTKWLGIAMIIIGVTLIGAS